MSFRQAATSVRAGIKSGAYQKKTDNFSAFAQGFAPIFAQGMKDKKDLKMAEMKTIAEEKRWDRRQAAKAQEKIDKYDKKTLEVATLVASELGVDPSNTAAMAMITPFVAGTNNNFASSYEYLKKQYNWSDITSSYNSSATPPATSTATPPVTQLATPTAVVTSQAVGWTGPLSKGEGNDNIDALFNKTKGKLSGKFANYKVSQNTIGANLDFARKGGESGYFDSSIGLVEGSPNSGTTPMGKWQFVHTTLEDIANRTNNFKDLGEGFENGLDTVFDAKAQDKIHAWYINDTLNQARKDGTNTRDNFVRRLKARYEAFKFKNPDTGNRFTDQEILNTVNPFVASSDKTTWATGGSWFGTVDYGDGQPVSNDVAAQTNAALVDGAASSSSLPTRLPELFSSKQEAMQIASRKDHPKYQKAVEYLKFDKEYGQATSADMIAGVNSLPELAAFETSVALMEETDPRKAILTAEIPKLRTKLEKFAPNAGQPDYMVDTVTTGNIASFTASVDAALQGLPETDPNRLAFTDRKLHLTTVAAMYADAARKGINFKLTDNYTTLTLKPTDNSPSREVRVQLTDQGKFFDITTQDFINPATIEKRSPSSKQVNTAVNVTNKFNQHFGNKLSQVKEDTVTLLKTAKQLDDLVLNNPAILTFVGGQATAFLTGLETEIQTLSRTIGSQQLSSSQVEAALMAKGQEYAKSQASNYGMASNADAFYRWTALNLRHAFSFAKLDLDSAGMALSNMDFKNALTINNVGKTYVTYSGNLKTQTNSVVEKALQRHALLLGDPEYKLALQLPLVAQAFEDNPTIMPLKEYLQQNAQDQYTWATSPTEVKPEGDNSSASAPMADPPAAAITDLKTMYAAANTAEARAKLLRQFKDHFKIDGSQYLKGDE